MYIELGLMCCYVNFVFLLKLGVVDDLSVKSEYLIDIVICFIKFMNVFKFFFIGIEIVLFF